MVQEIFPYNMRIKNETEFRGLFDSVENNFTALSRDYLLSQLMYRAYTYGIEVPPAYLKKYKKYSTDKGYRRTVYNTMAQQRRNNRNKIDSIANRLLAVDGKSIFSLENILAKHTGKFLLIDFWDSWCVPCRKEMPYLKELMQKYPGDKIVFLNVSLDKEIQVWQKAIIAANAEMSSNYLLINPDSSTFIKQFEIHTIPRYMLFDKGGKIINADAPRPSEPALSILLDNLIFQ